MRTALIGRSFSAIERVGLLTILVATLCIGHREVHLMVASGHAGVSDLLLFMYAEVISMVVVVHYGHLRLPYRDAIDARHLG